VFLPVSAFAFIGGLVHLAGGSLDLTIVNPVKPASNAAFSWAFLQGLNAIFGVSVLLFAAPQAAMLMM
jgi:NCS1 family nucleobase:cation symporter-1